MLWATSVSVAVALLALGGAHARHFAARVSPPHFALRSPLAARGGLNALLVDAAPRYPYDVLGFYAASDYTGQILRYDVSGEANHTVDEWRRVAERGGARVALGWRSPLPTMRTLRARAGELLWGDAASGRVWSFGGGPRGDELRELTRPSTGWPSEPIPGVRAFATDPRDNRLYAATCGADDALYYYDEARGAFCLVARGYGCLGNSLAIAQDGSLYAVSLARRLVLRVRGGVAQAVGGFPRDVFPVAAALDTRQRVYVLANRATPNQRQAEVHRLDVASGNMTFLGAVGGAVGDSLQVAFCNRIFFTDTAHHAIHEVRAHEFLRPDALKHVRDGRLVSGARHAGGASASAEAYGHASFSTHMLFGTEQQAIGGGVAAFLTHNYDTEVALLADALSLKSLTAERFVDTWPTPRVPNQNRFVGARNVHVAPARAPPGPDGFQNRTVLVTDWSTGELAELTGFAPHVGDFRVVDMQFDLGAPYGAVALADGTRIVADFAGNRVINAATKLAVHSAPLRGPVGLALDANETVLYASEYAAGRLVAIDLATSAVRVVAVNLTQPEGIAVSPLDGHVTLLESGGERRLLHIDPASGAMRELTRKVPSAGDSTPEHPGTLGGVAWTEARRVDTDMEFGYRSVAALYVTLDGDGTVRRYVATIRSDDPFAKPCDDASLFGEQRAERESDGRSVVTINLFSPDMPAPFAVPVGTWLRFNAHRLGARYGSDSDDLPTGPYVKEIVNHRFIQSADFGDAFSARLNASDLDAKRSSFMVHLDRPGNFSFTDTLNNGTDGRVIVYDAAYDDETSFKYCADPEREPEPEATPEPPCRREIECAFGYEGNATEVDERGCLGGVLSCFPIAKTKLGVLNQDMGQYPGAVHGGGFIPVAKPFLEAVKGGFHPVQTQIETPSFPGSIYKWRQWRNWWQESRPGPRTDPSYYWYAPHFRQGPEEEVLEDAC